MAELGSMSNMGAFANMMKNLIGLGILTLPYATAQVGWLPSLLGMIGLAFLSVSAILFAVMALEKLEAQRAGETAPLAASSVLMGIRKVQQGGEEELEKDEEEVGRLKGEGDCIDDTLGLSFFHIVVGEVLGGPFQVICIIGLALGQFACGVAYVAVVAENVETFVTGHDGFVLFMLGVLLATLSLTDTLERVSYLSIVGLLMYFWIFAALVYYNADGTTAATAVAVKTKGADYGTWFGLCNFAFAGLPLAVVIHDDMREPENFSWVIVGSYIAVWLFYATFAVLGYLCYGAESEEIIYYNFSSTSAFYDGSVVAVSIILLLSYVLQMMPLYSFTEILCVKYTGYRPHYSLLRTMLVFSTIAVAYLIPDLVVIIDELGTGAGVLVGFIFPALVYARLSERREILARVLCVLIFALGVMGGVMATFF